MAVDDPVEPWPPAPEGDETERLRAELERTRARLEAAERLADHDTLTPLLNRRGFERELGRTIAYCRRYGATAALIYLDLDGFKGVNDHYGHAAGDKALQEVAGALLEQIRETDVAGRLGGDEFAVILSQANEDTAAQKGRALSEAIASIALSFEGHRVQLGASWGVRAYEPDMTADQMLAEADAAMFLRKAGRGRRSTQTP
jgi:diguanylate cyclase (GGDEF)-like protein